MVVLVVSALVPPLAYGQNPLSPSTGALRHPAWRKAQLLLGLDNTHGATMYATPHPSTIAACVPVRISGPGLVTYIESVMLLCFGLIARFCVNVDLKHKEM